MSQLTDKIRSYLSFFRDGIVTASDEEEFHFQLWHARDSGLSERAALSPRSEVAMSHGRQCLEEVRSVLHAPAHSEA